MSKREISDDDRDISFELLREMKHLLAHYESDHAMAALTWCTGILAADAIDAKLFTMDQALHHIQNAVRAATELNLMHNAKEGHGQARSH